MQPYYSHGGIEIFLGDCRGVLPGIDPSSVDLLLSDPPYGISYSPAGGGRAFRSAPGSIGKTFSGKDLVHGDNEPFDPALLLRFKRVMLFGANHYADKLPPSPTWIVWDKREGRTTNDFADCELLWSNCGGPARLFHHMWNGLMKASEVGQPRVHPSQKPVVLMTWLLELYSECGDLILDPYMGSGTTLVAAKMLGRRAIGVEILEKYAEIAARRLDQEVLPLPTTPAEIATQAMLTEVGE